MKLTNPNVLTVENSSVRRGTMLACDAEIKSNGASRKVKLSMSMTLVK